MYIVTASQMQELDRRTIRETGVPGNVLMERAGNGVVSTLEKVEGSLHDRTVSIFCGKGNNGGDGFVVARLLRQKRCKVHVCLLAKPQDLNGDAKTMYQRYIKLGNTAEVLTCPSQEKIQKILGQSDLVVDALLGTGISSTVKDEYAATINTINASGLLTIAVDIPSGIQTDTGAILGTAIRAKFTITFGYPKLGLFLGPAIDHVGEIHQVAIGIPDEHIENMPISTTLITANEIKRILPDRKPSSHKGTYGHTGIIAGSLGKTGAAALAALAALRVGTGLATIATPQSVNASLESKTLEAMTLPMPETSEKTLSLSALPLLQTFAQTHQALGLGPGLTTHPETMEMLQALISKIQRPCVIDADALNALAGKTDILRNCHSIPVLTPHPGEMARLIGNVSAQHINAHRLTVAQEFAQQYACILVLKGARTIVAEPDGQAAICPTGNPGMATAGMGDVLTGMIAGLLAQGIPPGLAAKAGVFLHGLAGDLGMHELGQASLMASDVLDFIPQAILTTQQETSE